MSAIVHRVGTTARWFGPAARPLLGWWSAPSVGAPISGVVILPPIGYEYWSSHRTLRTLAERLAARGHGVLRIDYDGLGDSAGGRWDDGRVPAWRASVAHAVEAVRGLGASQIALVGLRMGATLALVDAGALDVDRVVAWAPVTSGKRFMKELRMLGLAVPATAERPAPGNTIVYAGTVFSPETAAALGAIDTDKLGARPAPRVLVVARPDRPCDATIARLRELGAEVDVQALPGAETALDLPAEEATVPAPIVDGIVDWLGAWLGDATPATGEAPAASPARAVLPWGDGAIVEEVVSLGEPRLVGVLGGPAEAPAKDTVVVFLSSGSEPHSGPGRCWVEYTRELALRGYATVRLDFSGWGESPDLGHAPGRPYDAHCVDEALAVVAALRARGHRRVVLAGLCAGAWVAMRAARIADADHAIDGVVALNPQLYWQPGDIVESRITDTMARRVPIRAREAAKRARWSRLDAAGFQNYAGRWLTALDARKARVLLLFAEGDEGLVYLETRLARLFARVLAHGSIRKVQVDDVDHQMYREWRRGDVVARMVEYLDELRA